MKKQIYSVSSKILFF